MSYRLRRIDPFWKPSPVVLGVAGVGLVIGLFGFSRQSWLLMLIGGIALTVGVLMAAKPAVSAVLGCLGLFGGLVTFVIMPNAQMTGLAVTWRLIATVVFSLLYMVLMDALVMVVAALYNFFNDSLGWGGIHLDFEEAPSEETPQA